MSPNLSALDVNFRKQYKVRPYRANFHSSGCGDEDIMSLRAHPGDMLISSIRTPTVGLRWIEPAVFSPGRRVVGNVRELVLHSLEDGRNALVGVFQARERPVP